jgi:hypothetical protein
LKRLFDVGVRSNWRPWGDVLEDTPAVVEEERPELGGRERGCAVEAAMVGTSSGT